MFQSSFKSLYIFALVVSGVFSPNALAQTSLEDFLAPLQTYPSLQAAQASLNAAERNLSAAYDPVALSVEGSYLLFEIEDIDINPQEPGTQTPPADGATLSASVQLRPFPFGDIADVVKQRELELEQAQIAYLNTLTTLEAQALEAAFNVQLAQEGVALAENAEQLSLDALEATRIRLAKGAANERELRDAEAGYLEAQTQVLDARARLVVAQASLTNFVGDQELPDLDMLRLPLPEGVPVAVQNAALAVAGANVAKGAASRALYPVVSAGYNRDLDDNSSIGLSIESRTLQPSLTFSYEDPVQGQTGGVKGTFRIGVSASISPGAFDRLAAVDEDLAAAEANLVAAQEGAALQEAVLSSTLTQAQRASELEALQFENAQLTLEETRRREELGLSIPLNTQQAVLELSQAALELEQTQQSLLAAILDIYEVYAQPISSYEVPTGPASPAADPPNDDPGSDDSTSNDSSSDDPASDDPVDSD